ncbi:MAG: hypothetical protein WD851_17310 [Pirellulales bacterium]
MSFRFAAVATVGSLAMAVACEFGSLDMQIGMLGALVSILAGLFLSYVEQEEERDERQLVLLKQLSIPVKLAADAELYAQYAGFCDALSTLAMQTDPILREIGLLKSASVRQEISLLADGTVVFSGTESWRTVYEKLLRDPEIHEYQSVAWVRTKDYWQDPPGRQSLALNFDAVQRGVLIERIMILGDELWPAGNDLPTAEIRPWIEEQYNHGFWICLVRESELASEPDLRVDMGLYGPRAVGFQEIDERCRTLRFTLHFDVHQIRIGRDRWKRLLLFAIPYRELLDRNPPPE